MDLSNAKLQPVYQRNGRSCYLDPIRKKLIYVTPEETLRQKVVFYLLHTLKVPAHMIRVEDSLTHYGLNLKKRPDIVILSGSAEGDLFPLAVIECKADTVSLSEKEFHQVSQYSDWLGSTYTVLTNGASSFCYKYDEDAEQYVQIEDLPEYDKMIKGEYVRINLGELPERYAFEALEEALADCLEDEYFDAISYATPKELAIPLFNLWECLLDTRVKMPVGDYGSFRLIEDYGVRMMSYGNGSGGRFFGPYRSFLVDVNGSTEFYSIAITTFWKSVWNLDEKPPKTCICVAHDDEKVSHHALQLCAEDNAVCDGDTVKFYHHGRIAVGRIGSGKKAELMRMVGKAFPSILCGDKVCLGSVKNDHLLRLDEPDIIDLVVNLITYAIIRDEYRQIVKNRTNQA